MIKTTTAHRPTTMGDEIHQFRSNDRGIILLKSSYKRNRRRLGENRLRRTTCKMTNCIFTRRI